MYRSAKLIITIGLLGLAGIIAAAMLLGTGLPETKVGSAVSFKDAVAGEIASQLVQ